MSTQHALLAILADGRFHSGARLGERLGISRTAVWKHLQRVERLGVEVHAVTGKGYRLADPLDLLSVEAILQAMPPAAASRVSRLDVLQEVGSTNRHAAELAKRGAPAGYACLAERQTAGRGRRGRQWQSPYGAGISLSLLWWFHGGLPALGGLSLAVGVALIRTLAGLNLEAARLKWPNDVQVGGRKLAGVLLEASGEGGGPIAVVIGVGLNVRVPRSAGRLIDQPWTDLETVLRERVSRNRLAASLLDHVTAACHVFDREGLKPFLHEWRMADATCGKPVELQLENDTVFGIARGVDSHGAMLIETEGALRAYHYGEVSLRFAD